MTDDPGTTVSAPGTDSPDDAAVATDGGEADAPTVPRFDGAGELGRRVVATLEAVTLSAAVSASAAVLAALLVGVGLVGWPLTLLSLVAGGGLATGLTALSSDRLRVLFASGVALTPAAALLAGVLGVGLGYGLRTQSAVGHLAGAVVLLLAVVGFAAVFTAVPFGEAAVLAASFGRFLGMLVPLTVAQVFTLALAAGDTVAASLARLVVDSPEPLLALARVFLAPQGPAALLTFLVFVVLLVALLRAVVGSLPLATLFPPRQRPSVTDRLDRTRRLLSRALFVAVLGSTGVYAAALVTGTTTPPALAAALGPLGGVAFWLLTTVPLRVVLVLVVDVLVVVLVAERVRRRVRRRSEADLLRQVLPAAGAITAALVVGVALDAGVSTARLRSLVPATVGPVVDPLLAGGVLPASMTVVFASLIVVAALFVLLTLLAGSPLLPERALGPAVAAGATFALVVALALFGGSPAAAFAGAALAFLAWDTGEFATGLREDLPPEAATVRGELVHVGGTVAVAVAAVLGALVLDLLVASALVVPSVPDATLAAGALTLAFATVVVLLSSLRE